MELRKLELKCLRCNDLIISEEYSVEQCQEIPDKFKIHHCADGGIGKATVIGFTPAFLINDDLFNI